MRRFKHWAPAVIITLVAAVTFYPGSPGSGSTQDPIPVREPTVRGAGGAIEGRVTNAEGQAVAGALVTAEPKGASARPILTDISDGDGNYRIEVERPGTYVVYGSKKQDGYATTLSAFHQLIPLSLPEAEVGPNEVAKGVEVNLGAKCSIVTVIVTDGANGRPINNVGITLRRADNPQMLYGVSEEAVKKNGKFKVLVPPVPFTLRVSTHGYEPRTVGGRENGDEEEPLVVGPGEVREIRVALRPQKEPRPAITTIEAKP